MHTYIFPDIVKVIEKEVAYRKGLKLILYELCICMYSICMYVCICMYLYVSMNVFMDW